MIMFQKLQNKRKKLKKIKQEEEDVEVLECLERDREKNWYFFLLSLHGNFAIASFYKLVSSIDSEYDQK